MIGLLEMLLQQVSIVLEKLQDYMDFLNAVTNYFNKFCSGA